MKKVFCIVLALVLACCVSAFAEEQPVELTPEHIMEIDPEKVTDEEITDFFYAVFGDSPRIVDGSVIWENIDATFYDHKIYSAGIIMDGDKIKMAAIIMDEESYSSLSEYKDNLELPFSLMRDINDAFGDAALYTMNKTKDMSFTPDEDGKMLLYAYALHDKSVSFIATWMNFYFCSIDITSKTTRFTVGFSR